MRPSIDLIEYALKYAQMGIYVIPIKPGEKTPLLKNWQDRASANAEKIREWWGKHPNANIALHTGKSGLIVLDIDPRNGGFESLDNLKDLLSDDKWLSPYKVKSGGGGLHFYYSATNLNTLNALDLGEGIDLLYGNKYVIAPPSVHPSGELYAWTL